MPTPMRGAPAVCVTATDEARARRRARACRLRGLYAVTPDHADTAQLVARVEAALDGGAAAIQYRNKSADAATRRAQAAALCALVRGRGALFVVNDDAPLAAEVDADGVHLGEDDGGIADARRAVGPDRIVGMSCYDDYARALAAVAGGADYVAFGSFFASAVKPQARRADVSLLGRAQHLGVPLVAIGGIDATNAAALIDAGAHAVAVISAVFGARDVAGVRLAASTLAAASQPPVSVGAHSVHGP
jgi:thiamine-phosphate pyrophosphorylase